jgi:putative ABC transport system permease protein
LKKSDNHIGPPRLATKLFKAYCKNELGDSILGDLQEQFYLETENGSLFKARKRYWLNVFTFINRHTLKSKRNQERYQNNTLPMFRNYARITFRNLKKHPVFSFINIFGLAIGLASCMVIFLYLQRELSFDKFHSNSDNIYKVASTYERPNATFNWIRTPPALAPAIRENFPGIGRATRLRYTSEHVYAVDDKIFTIKDGFYADSLFLEMFDFKLASGDANSALDEPNNIVLSQNVAERFFGEDDPMGQLIRFDNEKSFTVTGVFEPLPTNSHIEFDLLISFSTFQVSEGNLADLNSWAWGGFHTYIELNEAMNLKGLEDNISSLYGQNYARTDTKVNVTLQPLEDLYLGYSYFTNRGAGIKTGDKSTIYTLSIIAVLVLLVASLNFMNLSTAFSLNRGKEIGMRKVMGAVKSKIRSQFLVESILIAFTSMLIGVGIVWFSEPLLKELLGLELPSQLADYILVIPLFLLGTLIIGLMAGLYPSIILSAFTPIKALKGRLKTSTSGTVLRNGLTVFQFVISVALLTGSLIVVKQTNFLKNRSLGFNEEHVLYMEVLGEDMVAKYHSLKNTLLRNPNVSMVSRSSRKFVDNSGSGPARLKGVPENENHQLSYYQTGFDLPGLMELELIEGRFFSRDFPNDTLQALILNQTAVKNIGLENPIGQRIHFNDRERIVIGVVKDFNFASLHSPIASFGMVMPFTEVSTILIKTTGGNIAETISTIEEDWKSVFKNAPFDAKFLDNELEQLYQQEARLSQLVSMFSILAIILACLGLYGLVAFSIQARLKEVGIRKVLGGSLKSLLFLLSKQFMVLILIAILIACPLVYYLGNDWLSNFSYQTNLDVALFLLPSIGLIVLAVITISYQVINAALTNPVKVLRNE